jgi:formamidopyrimidine-DNA glycosylase
VICENPPPGGFFASEDGVPELPEVETTRRGILGAVRGRRIERAVVRERRLRWPVPADFERRVSGRQVVDVSRRAKYLVMELDHGALLIHLGMSGSLRMLPPETPLLTHDHLDLLLDSGRCLRFNDPRRFGTVQWIDGDPSTHELLRNLGPEPLGDGFGVDYLVEKARGRKVAVKQFLMDQRIVVGVGNIYASEALFRAGISPRRAAGRVGRARFEWLVPAVRDVLGDAIREGGTTLRDYVSADGNPGYFRQKLYVYERSDEPCRICSTPIRHIVQGQRSTYFCPTCQR